MQVVHFSTFLAIYLFVSLVDSQSTSCSYGGFDYDTTSTCAFNCEYDGIYYKEISTLDFNFIAEACGSVANAARMGLCSSLDDLVYPTGSCGCPSCACTSSAVGTTAIDSFETVLSKTCLSCTCVADPTPTYTYQCSTLGDVNSPYNWNDFTCQDPPITCTNSVSGDTYYPGQSWFEYTTSCDKFCYCDSSGQSQCETGFVAIIGSAYSQLVAAFYEKCNDNGHELTDCMSDASRMVAEDGPSCSDWDCPKCDCNGAAVGDAAWFTEHPESYGATTALTCSECHCERGYSNNYTECDSSDNYAIG
eukprot:580044_1